MANEDFLTNIARMIAAELYATLNLQTAREMYGKSYFSLGVGEKGLVDSAVFEMIALNYQAVTAEKLATQKPTQVAGFQGTMKPKPE